MISRTLQILFCAGALLSLATFAGLSFAQKADSAKTPGELLPAESVFYLRVDGTVGHEEAYAQTVAYQALNESGLLEMLDKMMSSLSDNEETAGLAGIIQHLKEHGASVAIAVAAPEGKPVEVWGTAVVPFAGEGVDLLAEVLTQVSKEKVEVHQTKVKGRQIKYIDLDNPLVELGWWAQGESLVLGFGMNAIANSLAVADEERPNITSHPLWERYSNLEDDFDVTQLSWLDFESLRNNFGERAIPIPDRPEDQPLKVNQILEILGLHTLNHAATLSGYREESLWTEFLLEAPGEKTGLLKLLDQEPFTLDDLPAMPLHHLGLMAFSFDANSAYEALLKIVRDLVALDPKEDADKIDDGLAKFEEELGFSPQDLLGSLGKLHCLYTDSSQSMFGLGSVALVQVDDQDLLTECLRKVLTRIAVEAEKGQPNAFQVEEVEGDDRTVFRLNFPKAPIFTPTISVGEDWLIVGLMPQAVDAQIMRIDGTLFSWSIEEDLADSLEMFPDEMTSLHIVDPAGTYRTLVGLAPTILALMQQGMIESGSMPPDWRLPIDLNAIPPAELVVQHLFINVGVTTSDENGWHAFVRQSLPGIPFLGGSVGPGIGVSTSAVLVALLLPAVQQAREAARRSQSKNNLKQLGLAMHNYHEAHNHLPEGTIPNADLEPEERLSWIVSLLPFLEHARIYNAIDKKAGWEAQDNSELLSTTLPVLLNPSQSDAGEGPFGKTNYVGIGGLGEDGPLLPVTSKKAGIFGYNRATRFRDVTDGLSNTVMISDSSEVTPWGEGGRATIRAFTQEPYVNGPDGIGSRHTGGVQMVLGDGSVRFISENIDPKTLEALATIRGGEVVDDF